MSRGRSRKLWRGLVLVIAVVAGHRAWRATGGCSSPDGPDTSADALAVVSWNLHNFPDDDGLDAHDRDRMRARIDAVDPHVLAVQEVRDPAALAELLPDRRVLLSAHGGARGQALGLAVDDRVEVVGELVEHHALEIGGRVRPAVSAYLRVPAASGAERRGVDLHVVVVHLKAMPEGQELRRVQWALLADVIARLPLAGPGAGDDDVLVLGDFNATGADGDAQRERDDLARVLAEVGLRPLAIAGGCSAYWDGERRDAWLEPTLLDLAFVGGAIAEEGGRRELVATPLGACARHRCAPLRSTEAYPDAEIVGMSDHCPVLVELREPG
jgi:endonuclease/exonuclease/phosphatase family metal-dependent hydrolase